MRSKQINITVSYSLKVFNYKAVAPETAEGCAAETEARWLVTNEMGAENLAMRLFEMKSGGYNPLHEHPWEHEVFVIEGQGSVFDGEKAIQAGDVVFARADELHQFKNDSVKLLKFLCLVPYVKE